MRPATRCGLCTPAPAQICGWLDATAAPRPLVFFFSAASCDRRLSSLSYRRFLCTNGSIGATARRGGGGGVCLYIQTPPSLWGTIAASLSAMLLPLGHPQRVENRLRHGALQPPLKKGGRKACDRATMARCRSPLSWYRVGRVTQISVSWFSNWKTILIGSKL